MAFFDKQAYQGKAEWAAKKNFANSEKAIEQGMSEEQAEALRDLCEFRHKMHCEAVDALSHSESADGNNLVDELSCWNDEEGIRERIQTLFGEAPFARIDYESDSDYYNILDDEERDEYGDLAAYTEHVIEENTKNVEAVNRSIEAFLRKIDEQYNTQFCPTGFARAQF